MALFKGESLGGLMNNNNMPLLVMFEAITQLCERGGMTKSEWQALLAAYNWTVAMLASRHVEEFREDRNFVRKIFVMHMSATADKRKDEWLFNSHSDWQEIIDYFESKLK